MKNKELLDLYAAIKTMGNLKGVKFSYGIAKNLSKIEPEVEAIDKSIEEYTKKRIELAEKYAQKDKAGKPMSGGGRYIMEDEEEFNKALGELQDKDKEYQEYLEFIEEESKLKLHKIKLADVPEDINVREMNALINIIE